MAKAADIGSKRLIGMAPDAWVQWVTQRADVVADEVLASEFQWVSRDSDALIRVHSPQEGEFLVLTEVQFHYDKQMPRRMHAYAALAEERYRMPVYPVVVNILPPPATAPVSSSYESVFMGLRALREYRSMNLWEIDAEVVFAQPIPSLLPFVPVLRGGGEESIIRRAVHLLRQDETLRDLEPLLAFFASFALDIRTIQEIMRWDMIAVEKSPWYQEILQQGVQQEIQRSREKARQARQEGVEEGLQKGIQQGREEARKARQEERIAVLRQIVQMRFGLVPQNFQEQLSTMESEKIAALIDNALLAPSLETFLAQMNAISGE